MAHPRPRTTQNSLRAGTLSTLSASNRPGSISLADVAAFRGFSTREERRPSIPLSSTSSHHLSRPLPETPTRPAQEASASAPGGPPDDGDDDPPDDPPPDDQPEDERLGPYDYIPPESRVLLQLSRAIDRLSSRDTRDNEPDTSSKAKVQEPDTFDGTDPRKLRAFFVQCELNFQSRPAHYRNDHAKVTFAQSYLKGMALEWFEPDLLSMDAPTARPLWMDDYVEFMAELQDNFGPHDPAGDAEAQLEQLQLRDGQRINKYVVDFQHLASQVRGYGDGALRRQFYTGLPARIKDEISRVGKPNTLSELRLLVQTIDARYWECKGETSRKNHQKPKVETVQKSSSSSQHNNNSNNNCSNHNSRSNNAPKPSKPSSSAPDLTGKLDKDGKLTDEERKRRLDNRLCLFCAAAGHSARDCPKSTSRAAKARAATTTSAPKQEAKPVASSEAKK
jgi:hypothetical protein